MPGEAAHSACQDRILRHCGLHPNEKVAEPIAFHVHQQAMANAHLTGKEQLRTLKHSLLDEASDAGNPEVLVWLWQPALSPAPADVAEFLGRSQQGRLALDLSEKEVTVISST